MKNLKKKNWRKIQLKRQIKKFKRLDKNQRKEFCSNLKIKLNKNLISKLDYENKNEIYNCQEFERPIKII